MSRAQDRQTSQPELDEFLVLDAGLRRAHGTAGRSCAKS